MPASFDEWFGQTFRAPSYRVDLALASRTIDAEHGNINQVFAATIKSLKIHAQGQIVRRRRDRLG